MSWLPRLPSRSNPLDALDLTPQDALRLLPSPLPYSPSDVPLLFRSVPDAFLRSRGLNPEHWDFELVGGSFKAPLGRSEWRWRFFPSVMPWVGGQHLGERVTDWRKELFHIRLTYRPHSSGKPVPKLEQLAIGQTGDWASFVLPLPQPGENPHASTYPPGSPAHSGTRRELSLLPFSPLGFSFARHRVLALFTQGFSRPSGKDKGVSFWWRWPKFMFSPFYGAVATKKTTTDGYGEVVNMELPRVFRPGAKGWIPAKEAVEVVFVLPPGAYEPGTREEGERMEPFSPSFSSR
ncbi:hypothetical protein JCM8547_006265 [Rhodosporidiobolus lusitaniae]